MSDRILTLFGDELVPEQPRPAPRTKTKKRKDEDDTNFAAEGNENEPGEINEVPDGTTGTNLTAAPQQNDVATTDDVHQLPSAEPITHQTDTITEPVAIDVPGETTPTANTGKEEQPLTNLSEDWNGEKNYYTIGEVAELFKVKTSNIRFWTNEFSLKVRTTRKGDRLYTPAQIKELRAIYHLVKERKFTLSGARARLKSSNKKDVETIDLKQSLLALRAKLVTLKNQLNKTW